MRPYIEINGKKAKPAELTFNNVCRMEEMGGSMIGDNVSELSCIRAYIAISFNIDKNTAGNEIEESIKKNGYKSIESIGNALSEAVEESDFFQAIIKTENEETPEIQE